jgi:hypothetical protein
VFVSVVALFVTAYFSRTKASDDIATTLSAIVANIGSGATADKEVAAMRIAAKGDEALPALKMLLAARDDTLRQNAVDVATELYLSRDAAGRSKLAAIMVQYYRDGIRRGVIQWAATVVPQLSEGGDWDVLYGEVKKTFGEEGEHCSDPVPSDDLDGLAMDTSLLLKERSAPSDMSMVIGLIKNCGTRTIAISRARTNAAQALGTILEKLWPRLSPCEQIALFYRLRLIRQLPSVLQDQLDRIIATLVLPPVTDCL